MNNKYNFATANLSFSLALGVQIGSEKKWLEKIAENNGSSANKNFLKTKAKDTMELIAEEFISNRLDAIGLQELNTYNHEPGIKTFEEAFRQVVSTDVNDFARVKRDAPNDKVEVNIKGIGKYCIISFGVIQEKGVPTVALIYNIEKLGIPEEIFYEDCEVAGQKGRPMLGVITNMGFAV